MRQLLAALLLAAIAGPAVAQAPALIIELDSFAYRPKTIQLVAGKPVTLAFVNRSGSGHGFTAKKFFASSRFIAGTVPGGVVELKGGHSSNVTLIPSAGSYSVHCGHFMHKQLGMSGLIIVR